MVNKHSVYCLVCGLRIRKEKKAQLVFVVRLRIGNLGAYNRNASMADKVASYRKRYKTGLLFKIFKI